MIIHRFLLAAFLLCISFQPAKAVSDLAPALPDLTLPAEVEAVPVVAQSVPATETAAPSASVAKRARQAKKRPSMPPVTNTVSKVNTEEIAVENLMPSDQQTVVLAQAPAVVPANVPAQPEAAPLPVENTAAPVPVPAVAAEVPAGVPSAEAIPQQPVQPKTPLVQYNPPTDRDPTLSPDDALLLKHREEERLRALEAERQRKLEEERRRLAELERQRRLELERLRDPSREIRGRIRVSGIIGQEAFIGNRIYSVGQTILGARIVEVRPDSVVFTYKGQRFIKNVDLK